MVASKVYYMDARSHSLQTGLVPKMLTTFEAAGFDKIIKPGDVVAIKVHCGEWNNTAYLRPVYARALADHIKTLGGRPFVCDTTTQPYGVYATRVTELDFLTTAERNGYNATTLGCPFICADGFMGTDDYRVDLPEGYILKEAYIATAIASADVLITLTHFKGHGIGVVGGALKNLGIGAQSKRGKFNVHMGCHPKYGFGACLSYTPEKFKGRKGEADWRSLEEICPFDLIHVTRDSIEWERDKCVTCLACLGQMTRRGIWELNPVNFAATNAAIADACLGTVKAVGKGKVAFINMAIDCVPGCDCVPYSDMPLVPHIGVFAGFDPVAIDKACVDKALAAQGITGSAAQEMEVLASGSRKFEFCAPLLAGLSEEAQLNTGEVNGLGMRAYDLVQVPEKQQMDFVFPPDPRPIGIRMREKFAKIPPFPYDRHDGKGFMREEEVDLDRVNTYYDGHEKK